MIELPPSWSEEDIHDWHERVAMRLEHIRQPWPDALVAAAEQRALVDIGRARRARQVARDEAAR